MPRYGIAVHTWGAYFRTLDTATRKSRIDHWVKPVQAYTPPDRKSGNGKRAPYPVGLATVPEALQRMTVDDRTEKSGLKRQVGLRGRSWVDYI